MSISQNSLYLVDNLTWTTDNKLLIAIGISEIKVLADILQLQTGIYEYSHYAEVILKIIIIMIY